jgi:hypothetical protein
MAARRSLGALPDGFLSPKERDQRTEGRDPFAYFADVVDRSVAVVGTKFAACEGRRDPLLPRDWLRSCPPVGLRPTSSLTSLRPSIGILGEAPPLPAKPRNSRSASACAAPRRSAREHADDCMCLPVNVCNGAAGAARLPLQAWTSPGPS